MAEGVAGTYSALILHVDSIGHHSRVTSPYWSFRATYNDRRPVNSGHSTAKLLKLTGFIHCTRFTTTIGAARGF